MQNGYEILKCTHTDEDQKVRNRSVARFKIYVLIKKKWQKLRKFAQVLSLHKIFIKKFSLPMRQLVSYLCISFST